jgi:hypothetical protein
LSKLLLSDNDWLHAALQMQLRQELDKRRWTNSSGSVAQLISLAAANDPVLLFTITAAAAAAAAGTGAMMQSSSWE